MNDQILVISPNTETLSANRTNYSTIAGEVADKHTRESVFASKRETLAKNTIAINERELRAFETWLNQVFSVKDNIVVSDLNNGSSDWKFITYGLVVQYIEHLKSSGYAIGTINGKLSVIKRHCLLASKAALITDENMRLITTVKSIPLRVSHSIDEKREVTRISNEKVKSTHITKEREMMLVDNHPETAQGARNKLLMSILLFHGLRIGEVLLLTKSSFQGDFIVFTQPKLKTGKLLRHELSAHTQKAYLNYLEYFKGDSNAPLFVGSKKNGELSSNPASKRALQYTVNVLGNRVGISKLSPHDCRHHLATRLANEGWAMIDLLRVFGWSSPSTAMRYIEAAKYSVVE